MTTVLYDQLSMNIDALAMRLREFRRPVNEEGNTLAVSRRLRSAFAAGQRKPAPDGEKNLNSIFIGIQIPSAQ